MVYLAVTSLIWAFSFGIIGSSLKGLNLLQVADARLWLAFLVFLPFLRLRHLSVKEQAQLMGLGAVQYGLMYSCYLSAFSYLPSHLVALFSLLTPLYIVLLHDLQQRKFSPRYLLAAALSVLGAVVIKIQDKPGEDIWFGFALMQVANLAFAFGQLYYRDWRRQRPNLKDSQVFALLYFGGGVSCAVLILLLQQSAPIPLELDGKQLMALIYLGLVASGLGFFLWNKGATQVGAGLLAAFNNAVVPLAMFTSLFVFGEAKNVSDENLVRLALGSGLIALAFYIGAKSRELDGSSQNSEAK